MPHHRFRFQEVFPPDDVRAEWVATLALAFNDLSLVRVQMGKDEASKYRWLYWFRLGIAHFAEAASYLRDTTKIPEISAFIDSLPAHVRGHLRECLDCYADHEEVIERIRNEAGFHYPELEIQDGKRRKRPMQAVLEALGGNCGQIVGETIGDARLLFADDIASMLVLRAHGGGLKASAVEEVEVLGQVHIEIEGGSGPFLKFVSGVLGRHVRLAVERGAEWEPIPDEPS